ncbi:MAG: thioredoxin domain-containing protein, partial [Solirubrobacterales bacterium]
MANRLAEESSPYLLQHAGNPVDWYPWGPEALARAREERKPILVSIGYSSCHWCHVMEHESFEDPDVARYMNEHFVCIKVDREERPDIDAIYIDACTAMTGQAGWPLNAFLTPEQVPFYAGTYFPPADRPGMPSWRRVMEAVTDAWENRREEIEAESDRTREQLSGAARLKAPESGVGEGDLELAVERLREAFDPVNGGFGGAPKFPPASQLEFLLARGEEAIPRLTLASMASGGIFDQVGGGFARYSVDAGWVVPHFEKMLYDNALLARAYLHGWQALGDERFREVCEMTLDWALREMRGPEGGFYSALDADSGGGEGLFYTWTREELLEVLGEEAGAEAIAWFGVTEEGNFEGRSVLVLAGDPNPGKLAEVRSRLLEARSARERPGLDDKRLTAWNALMAGALAEAGAALGREDYLAAAAGSADFILEQMVERPPEGPLRLMRTWKDGEARLNGYLEDYAFLVEALVSLYEATFESRWLAAAREVADAMIDRFADPGEGGFFSTASDHEELIARRKEIDDNPIPSGNSAAALGLLRLYALTAEPGYRDQADRSLALLGQVALRHPQSFGHALLGLDWQLGGAREVALAGDDGTLAAVVRGGYRPRLVLAGGDPGGVPLLAGRDAVDGRPSAYVCEDFTCARPVGDAAELEA